MASKSQADGKINVLLFGLGGIGSFYAYILGSKENISLSVVARSNYNAVKEKGLIVDSENHGKNQVRIDHVLKSSGDSKTPFDYIVCCHKAINPASIPAIFKSVTNDDTTFVIIQNGVGNEDPFRKTYPRNTIISCVTWVGATQPTPGVVKHAKGEDMQIGLYPNKEIQADVEDQRLKTFASLLEGTKFQVVPDVQVQRWSKVVWNCAWNPITTLIVHDTKSWLESSDDALPITKRLMLEVIQVARGCGVDLKDELADELIKKVQGLGGIFSSMKNDADAGRPLEVDVIVGYPTKKAKELGIDVPVLRMICALTMAVNQRLTSAKM